MANEQLLADLEALDAFFSDESKWTKKAFARAATGNPIGPAEDNATCWCLLGAVTKHFGSFLDGRGDRVTEALDAVSDKNDAAYAQDNPDFTFADLKTLIARARANVEARP